MAAITRKRWRAGDHSSPNQFLRAWRLRASVSTDKWLQTQQGVEHYVCYASRSCNAAEKKYSSFDGECLVVVWATRHSRSHLIGNSFTIGTDFEPLKWIVITQNLTGKVARWSLLMREYDFRMVHGAGTENNDAECFELPFSSLDQWSAGHTLDVRTTLSSH